MIDTGEPKNGDFIAYLEQLQRESAVRLLGDRSHQILDQALSANAKRDSGHFFTDAGTPGSRRSPTALASGAAQQMLRNLFLSIVPILFGALFFFYWLMAATTFLPLAVAIVLVAWGVRLFGRAARQLPVQSRQAQAAVSKVFSAPTKVK